MIATRSEVKPHAALGLVGLIRLAMTSLVWLGLFACNGEARGPTLSVSPDVLTAPATTAVAAVPSGTYEGSATPLEATTPIATRLPPNVFALEAHRWPEEEDLLLGVEQGAEFGTTIGELAPGDYLVVADKEIGLASVYHLETERLEVLVRAPPAEYLGVQFTGDRGEGLVSFRAFPRSWWFYDAVAGGGWGLGETCSGRPPHRMSPGGGWIGAICHDFIQMTDVPFEHVVMEVLSTQEGVGTRIAIPSSPTQRDRPYMAWLDDERVLVSTVWVVGELRACTVSFQQATMFCPPLGLDSMVSHGVYTSPESLMIPFIDSQVPPRAALVPRECLASNGVCPGVEWLQIDESLLITTSDPEIIWWIEPLAPDPTTEIGLVDLDTRTLTQLASLGGDYSSRGPCPDGSCLFLFQHDNEINWRLNLDGSLQVLPFRGDVIIGSFRIP